MITVMIKRKDGSAEAEGVFENGKIVVKKGSKIKMETTSQFKGFSAALKNRIDREVVSEDGIVKKDILFNSPSMAGAFVLGTSVNGWSVWKNEIGVKLSELVKE